MRPLPPSEFANLLAELDYEAFKKFLKDLWEARERNVQIENDTLTDARGSYLIVYQGSWWYRRSLPSIKDENIDGLIINHRIDPTSTDVRVIDANRLREMVLYAIDKESREELFHYHFDRSSKATESPWSDWGLPPISRSTSLFLFMLVMITTAVAVGSLPSGLKSPSGRTTASLNATVPTVTPTEDTVSASSISETQSTTQETDEESILHQSDMTLLQMSGSSGQSEQEVTTASFEIGSQVAIVEYVQSSNNSVFGLWMEQSDGTRRWLVGGSGSEKIRILLDIPRGKHEIFVQSTGRWNVTIRSSQPLSIPKNPYSFEHAATEYAGPIAFFDRTNITIRGFDPNKTYIAIITDRGGHPQEKIVNRTNLITPVSTNITYQGEGFVRMTSTGRWMMILRQAD